MKSRWVIACVAIALVVAACSSKKGTGPEDKGPAGRLYVLNQGDGTMFVYDTKTLQRIDSVETGVDLPHYIEFAPFGHEFYITTLGRPLGQVGKFDASTLELKQSSPAPGTPSAIAITKDGLYGYVCNFASDPDHATRVSKYDLTTMDTISSVQAGGITHDLKITSDGSIVVVCNRTSDDVTLIYPDADTVAFVKMDEFDPQPIGASHRYGPLGIVIDHKDSLAFVACIDAQQVRWIDLATRKVVDSIDIPVNGTGPLYGPTLMAISPDNDVVFVTTQQGNSVVAFRVSTKEILADIPLAKAGSFGISMSDDGSRVYVACIGPTDPTGRFYVIEGNTYAKLDSADVGHLNYGLIWQPAERPMPG